MTKSFSVAATLLLRDEGVLRLDDPIGDHAPELAHLRSPTADAPAITIRDLIGMSSGLVSDDPWADRHLDLGDDELDDIVADGLVFAGPTGACFEYSNLGYALLGRVVHRATGRRLQEHVTERLLEPLGMERHDVGATGPRRLGTADAAARRRLDRRGGDPSGTGPSRRWAGLWTTVADLARWVGWLADAFPARDDADDGPLLRRSSRREMQSPQRYAGRAPSATCRSPSRTATGRSSSTNPPTAPSSGTPAGCRGTARTCAGGPADRSGSSPCPT
jgi:CubicO group peptidase (beta-lactamase class C family)